MSIRALPETKEVGEDEKATASVVRMYILRGMNRVEGYSGIEGVWLE